MEAIVTILAPEGKEVQISTTDGEFYVLKETVDEVFEESNEV